MIVVVSIVMTKFGGRFTRLKQESLISICCATVFFMFETRWPKRGFQETNTAVTLRMATGKTELSGKTVKTKRERSRPNHWVVVY